MDFFFSPDYRHRYRFFSTESVHEIQVEFSRWKKLWRAAKEKLMLLPVRILRQEQAFEKILKLQAQVIRIHYPDDLGSKRLRAKFFFFLQRQKTKHVLLLIVETILLPISGLMALLPGPNIFFGILALIMYTHWQALRGINHMGKLETEFKPSALLRDWHLAVKSRDESRYTRILEEISQAYDLTNLNKVLYK